MEIQTEADYKEALAEVNRLFDAVPGTSEFNHLDVLATLIEAYEAKVTPIALPAPIKRRVANVHALATAA